MVRVELDHAVRHAAHEFELFLPEVFKLAGLAGGIADPVNEATPRFHELSGFAMGLNEQGIGVRRNQCFQFKEAKGHLQHPLSLPAALPLMRVVLHRAG